MSRSDNATIALSAKWPLWQTMYALQCNKIYAIEMAKVTRRKAISYVMLVLQNTNGSVSQWPIFMSVDLSDIESENCHCLLRT